MITLLLITPPEPSCIVQTQNEPRNELRVQQGRNKECLYVCRRQRTGTMADGYALSPRSSGSNPDPAIKCHCAVPQCVPPSDGR